MYIRHQSGVELDNLNLGFLNGMLCFWDAYGIDAARCFALGA